MKLLGKSILCDFKKKHADSKSDIQSWESEVEEAQWSNPHELKMKYPKASILGNFKVVFNLCWNKYRLLIKVNYKNKIVLAMKIGTHKDYDKWDLS